MTTRVRLTAKERGDEVLRAAVQAFAVSGYEGTKTDEIARLAGVSQPYVIRLFGTKQQLFLAAVQSVCEQIEQSFRDAAAQRPELSSLGDNYHRLLAEPEILLAPAIAASAALIQHANVAGSLAVTALAAALTATTIWLTADQKLD